MTNDSVQQDHAASDSLVDRLDAAHEQQSGDFGDIWLFKEDRRFEGLVIRRATGHYTKGEKEGQPFPIVEVDRGGGQRTSIFGNRAKLHRLLDELDPRVGDRLAVAYYGEVQPESGGNAFHDFAVVVDRRDGELPDDVAEDEARAQTQSDLQIERDERDEALGGGGGR